MCVTANSKPKSPSLYRVVFDLYAGALSYKNKIGPSILLRKKMDPSTGLLTFLSLDIKTFFPR